MYKQLLKKTSIFLGPGTYEDQESYKHLTRSPCNAILKNYSGVNALDPNNCDELYYVGDNVVRDPNGKKILGRKPNSRSIINLSRHGENRGRNLDN